MSPKSTMAQQIAPKEKMNPLSMKMERKPQNSLALTREKCIRFHTSMMAMMTATTVGTNQRWNKKKPLSLTALMVNLRLNSLK